MRSYTYLNALLPAMTNLATASPSAQQWAERSIYVMTDRFARPAGSPDKDCDLYKYCGGSWAGIIDKLDYIQDLGFTAVQISPVVENIPDDTTYGEAYHGYWPQNLYALNKHFGSADDLRRLSKELHRRGMYLMVDVVINDMAQAINRTVTDDEDDINYSRLVPFNDEKYYHPACSITDPNEPETSKQCWLSTEVVALPDLKTEDEKVVANIENWVKGLIGNYSIDGLRVDATKHMNDAYLSSSSKAAGVFTMGDAYAQKTEDVCRDQEFVSGSLNYPLHDSMVQAFTAGDMPGLARKVKDVQSECKDFTKLATFVEDQKTSRFASLNNDTTLARNTMAFNILSDGIPMVYQGQEQHLSGPSTPYNRSPLWTTHYTTRNTLYNTTATLNKLRNHAIRKDRHYITKPSKKLYLDDSTYVTRKGSEGSQIVSVFSNQGSKGGSYNLTLQGAFKPETEVVEQLSCEMSVVNERGEMTVQMAKGQPRVFYPVRKMDGSGLCGFRKRRGVQLTSCSQGTVSIMKGNGDSPIVLNGSVEAGQELDQPSRGSGRKRSVSYGMAFMGVFVWIANWLL